MLPLQGKPQNNFFPYGACANGTIQFSMGQSPMKGHRPMCQINPLHICPEGTTQPFINPKYTDHQTGHRTVSKTPCIHPEMTLPDDVQPDW